MVPKGSDVSAGETHAFDDLNNLMEAKHSTQHQQRPHTNEGGQYTETLSVLEGDTLSSLPQASFNYINSIVGSGVIGIPYALHRAGFGLGLLLLVLVAYITDYSLILMVRCGHLCGRFSYPGIMEAAYGKYGYYLLSMLQFMYPFLAMISYNVVVGDTLSKVLVRFFPSWGTSMGAVRMGVVFFVTVGVVVPLCLYKNVSRLARASFISLACVVFILFAVIIKLLSGDYTVVDTPDSWRFANVDLIPATGIMVFVRALVHRFVLKEPISEFTLDKDPNLEKGADIDEYSKTITLAIVFSAFIISPLTDCLGSVLELNGLLAAIPLAYILPGLAYIQMESHSLFSREKLPALGLVVFGTIVTILGVAVLLPGLMGDCRADVVMDYCRQEFTNVANASITVATIKRGN
ncbi:unnamed protein product [Ceratitis capitata]|uniref:Putative sodium-coupled neutral amino acid transporter 11 n=1 Tax=Ceratitis capitata TaxID=7213 RepID=A0A811UIV5_CERCA|nr:unnamed protein product [Ceratitis capitata]